MNSADIYAAGVGAIFLIFIGWHIAEALAVGRRYLGRALRKYLSQSLVLTRRNGSTDLSVAVALGLLALAAVNVAACAVRVASQAQLVGRLGIVAMINLVPLYLGGRTSLFASRVCGLPLATFGTVHRWLGRICLIEAFAHGFLALSLRGWTFSALTILVLSVLICLAIFSFLFIRRAFFEFFLKAHLLLVLLLNCLLWFHVTLRIDTATIALAIASFLWVTQTIVWILRLMYRNIGGTRRRAHQIISLPEGTSDVKATLLQVGLSRPWRVTPGQYVYVTIPSQRRDGIQSHPYLIAWYLEEDNQASISLLIERRDGFSNRLQTRHHPTSLIVDGPYGKKVDLDGFDKVLFIASGVGVAAHLLTIRHLLQAHIDRSARVRRLTLVWVLDTESQHEWLREILQELVKMDSVRRILTILVFVGHSTTIEPSFLHNESGSQPRLTAIKGAADFPYIIDAEWKAEAGNMVVSLCGSPSTERHVRSAIRNSPYDIRLVTSPFQMDETSVGKKLYRSDNEPVNPQDQA